MGAESDKSLSREKVDHDDGGARGVTLVVVPGTQAHQLSDGRLVELACGDLRVDAVSVDLESSSSPSSSSPSSSPSSAAAAAAASDAPPPYTSPPSSDLWLVLTIGPPEENYTFPLPPTASVKSSQDASAARMYFFPTDAQGAPMRLTLRRPDRCGEEYADAVDTFESVLSQFATLHDPARPSGETDEEEGDRGTVLLVDEADGTMIGTLATDDIRVEEDPSLWAPGREKDPVALDLSTPSRPTTPTPFTGGGRGGTRLRVAPLDVSQYQNDRLLTASAYVSRGVVAGASLIGSSMKSAARAINGRSMPASTGSTHVTAPDGEDGKGKDNGKGKGKDDDGIRDTDGPSAPSTSGRTALRFKPSTRARVRQVHQFSGQAVKVSASTTQAVLSLASRLGSTVGQKAGIQRPAGEQPKGLRRHVNRGLIAFNVLAEGVEQGVATLVNDGADAIGSVVEHRYGTEARDMSEAVTGIGRSCVLIYKDFMGVRRWALLKVAGGTVKARLDDGRVVTLGSVDPVASTVMVGATGAGASAAGSSSSSSTSLGEKTTPDGPPALPPRKRN